MMFDNRCTRFWRGVEWLLNDGTAINDVNVSTNSEGISITLLFPLELARRSGANCWEPRVIIPSCYS